MSAIFDKLNLQITPNEVPTWSGTIPMNMYPTGTRVISTYVPLTQVSSTEYEYMELELWVDESSVKDESTMTLKGIPYICRGISKLVLPTVIAPSKEIFEGELEEEYEDDYEDYLDDYTVIEAEMMGDALHSMFENTGWDVRIDVHSNLLLNFPVVTEAAPVVTLNGSLLEQLADLLRMFSPNDLWGQSLSYYVNIFEAQIIIVAPEGNDSVVSSLAISDIRPKEIICREVGIDLPAYIYVQESEGALFRTAGHVEDYGSTTDNYDYTTSTTLTELDDDETEISATVTGERFRVGGLVLTENDRVQITQSTTSVVQWGFGGGASDPWGASSNAGLGFVNRTERYETGKTSDISTSVEYEYLLGPPYDEQADFIGSNTVNSYFRASQPGTRQQIVRDHGSVRIDKENYPDELTTVDGIQVVRKKTTTVEHTTEETKIYINGRLVTFPANIDSGDGVTTYLDEVFSYDEDGYLIGDRSRKIVIDEDGNHTITESFRVISAITEELSSEMTYTLQSSYQGDSEDGNLISSSVTDVTTQVVAAEQTGPAASSVLESSEDTDVLGEKLLIEHSSQEVKKVNADGSTTTVTEYPTGSVYVTFPTLTMEEMTAVLGGCYNLSPTMMYYATLSSEFIDVRGILGGFLKLTNTGGSDPNRSEIFSLTNDAIEAQELTGLLGAMNDAEYGFRVTGISMDWDGEAPPTLSIAMCQLVTLT